MKLEVLKREIMTRKKARIEIRERINDYCMKKFGIKNFFAIADKYLISQTGNFQICLARQIPTPNVEHLALYLAADSWGFQPLYLSLLRDSFPQQARENGYKKSLVCAQHVFRGRKGALIVQSERLSEEKMLQNVILSDIRSIHGGKMLPEVHWELMKSVIVNPPQRIDMSSFFKEILLSASKNLPEYVFARRGLREKLTRNGFSIAVDPRPPANWYYFFYLLLFVGGSRALASTVDKDPEVLAWFNENNQKIKEICGFPPLILSTPLEVEIDGFRSKLNEIPRKALSGNGFLPSIPRLDKEGNFFELMRHFEEQLILHA